MALPSATNPISMSMMNAEFGDSIRTTINLSTAATTFGDSSPHSFSELFGASSGRTAITLRYLELDPAASEDPIANYGWPSDGELVLCAENSTTGLDDIIAAGTWTSRTLSEFNSDSTITDGDTIFATNTGTTVTPAAGYQDGFFCETTQNVIFDLNSSGVVSGKRGRAPNQPVSDGGAKPTANADSATQVTLTIPSTNTVVTREFDIHRSIGGGSFSRVATVVPSASGSSSNTSVSTTYVDSSGISAGNSVQYKVFAQNAFATSSASQTSDAVTTPAGTQWGSFTNYSMILGSGTSQTLESSEKSLTLTNGSGNTTITVEQPNNSSPNPDLEIKVGDSSGNYNLITSYTETPSAIGARSTYFFKTKLTQAGSKNNSSETCDIVFTNNGVQKTITVTVEIGGLGLCIHESMLVDTPNGLKSIYELNVGDLVNSYDSELDIVESVPIDEIIKPMHKNLYKVNDLILTEDHPIFDENKKLLSISPELSKERYSLDTNKLEVGHKLKTLNNEELVVNNITRYDGEHQTYTILTKNNNFFVEGILVHSEI
jgi:hypothetical protein